MRKLLTIFLLLGLPPLTHAALRGTAGHVNTATANSITVTYSGSTIVSGDIILIGVITGGSTSASLTATGYTAATGALEGSNGTTFNVLYKTAVGGETSFVVNNSVTDYMAAQVRVYSGRSGTFTTHASSPYSTGASPYSYFAETFAPAASDDVVFFGSLVGSGGWTGTAYAAGTGFANGVLNADNSTSSFENGMVGSDWVNNSGGSASFPGGTITTSTGTPAGGGYFISLAAGGASCTNYFWSSTGAWAIPNGTTGSYWNVGTGAFSTPNCSTGSYWLKTGANPEP